MALEGADLCFDVDETDRLFREAYHRPLGRGRRRGPRRADRRAGRHSSRSCGPASRTGTPRGPRRSSPSSDATRGDLYEFLAEEVLATLSPELQHFLTRVALLDRCRRRVGDRSSTTVRPSDRRVIAECERLGLLTRPDRDVPTPVPPPRPRLPGRAPDGGDRRPRPSATCTTASPSRLELTDWYRLRLALPRSRRTRQRRPGHRRRRPRHPRLRHLRARRARSSTARPAQPIRPDALLLRSRLEMERGTSRERCTWQSRPSNVGRGRPSTEHGAPQPCVHARIVTASTSRLRRASSARAEADSHLPIARSRGINASSRALRTRGTWTSSPTT